MRITKDTVFGALALGLAVLYWAAADGLQRSFLADEVGADGVPKLLAASLAILAAILVLRELFGARRRALPDDDPASWRRHARAAGLLGFGIAYVVLLPLLGYPLTTAAFIGGVAAYAGQPLRRGIVLTAVAGSAVLWLIFDRMLAVSLPVGVWARFGL